VPYVTRMLFVVLICLLTSMLQMFVFNEVSGSHISTHQFEITGSTYAPEGEV